jgi:hypothetical protein
MPLSILVVGSENPRIRDLFDEVGRHADVSYLDTAPITRRPSLRKLITSWRWRASGDRPPRAVLIVPRRWRRISAALANWFIRKSYSKRGKPDVVVFTWPQLALLAEKLPDAVRVYYCKDPFDTWDWGPEDRDIGEMERKLLGCCDAVFAVSKLLAEDFQPHARGKVFYHPNAVSDTFLTRPPAARPANLPSDKPVVGCVGQINKTYDWEFISALAAALPEVRFCFVGNVDEEVPDKRQKVLQILTTTPNILWLGRQPHQELPAFIQHFDIAFCFLKANPAGNRRSPLRLYDYLASDRPVVSTPVAEAYVHIPHLHVAENPQDAAALVRRILAGDLPVDVDARRRYIQQQTWSVRAREFMEGLQQVLPSNPALESSVANITG